MSEHFNLTVRSSSHEYGVDVAADGLEVLLASQPDALLIVDQRFVAEPAFAGRRTLSVVADEEHKTLAEVGRLLVELREAGAGRSDRLIAVGGGVVQDVATLTAQLYMRGLPWSYAPTTLLAMVDSCIGGKSSINAGSFKNLVGSFYPPISVAVDPRFLKTLPEVAIAGGLAEATKIAYCRGPQEFERYLKLEEGFEADPSQLIYHSLDTKRWFIEIDEFDTGPRLFLNFGHTFGHALEVATDFRISHGIGIALGMFAAEQFGSKTGYGASDARLSDHAIALARVDPECSNAGSRLDIRAFEVAFLADKKHGPDGLHLILPNAAGSVAEVVVPRTDAMVAAASKAVDSALAMVVR
ncbi:MAG: 3-dehydroquinate synthase [Solirubrobacterales bacterium]|nr:3-dehydroquinate synthase [Solirubrobacterales bacterium]